MNGVRTTMGRPRRRAASRFGARWLRIVAGALAVFSGARTTSGFAEAQTDYRAGVRASWVEFASRLQWQFQRELSADNDSTTRFYDAMARLLQASDLPPTLVVRAWVTADGRVERLELEGSDAGEALHDLYAVLKGDGVGPAPPDMPQPLRMRLSLKPRQEK